MRFPCAKNPETGKPYTKHVLIDRTVTLKYVEQFPRVSYMGTIRFEPMPIKSVTLRVCLRPGCTRHRA